jgi:hypothetical protein
MPVRPARRALLAGQPVGVAVALAGAFWSPFGRWKLWLARGPRIGDGGRRRGWSGVGFGGMRLPTRAGGGLLVPVGVALAMARGRAQRGAGRRRGGGSGGARDGGGSGGGGGRRRRRGRRLARRLWGWPGLRRAFARRLATRPARCGRERRDRLLGPGRVRMSRGRRSPPAGRMGPARAGSMRVSPWRYAGPGDGDRIVNRAVLGSRPRYRERREVRPTLLGDEGHEPEAQRGGDAQQREGRAPQPLHQAVAREAGPGREPGQQLSSPGEHPREPSATDTAGERPTARNSQFRLGHPLRPVSRRRAPRSIAATPESRSRRRDRSSGCGLRERRGSPGCRRSDGRRGCRRRPR